MPARLITGALIAVLFLCGACDNDDNVFGEGRTNIAVFGYDTEQRGIWLEVQDAPLISVITCTDYARLYAVEGGGDRLLEPVDELVDPQAGYYLDGQFVPPDLTGGCDDPSCAPATKNRFFVSNLEYKTVGTQPLPEGYADHFPEGWVSELPTELPDVVSVVYEGPARLVLYYYPQDDCFEDDNPRAATLPVFVSDGEVAPR